MKNETLERELRSQLDRWGRHDIKLVQDAGKVKIVNTLPFQKSTLGVLTLDQNAVVKIVEDYEIADDPSFVKEPPIDIWGPWRRAFHCNSWWVVGHYLMYPCISEREANRVCSKLQADSDEG